MKIKIKTRDGKTLRNVIILIKQSFQKEKKVSQRQIEIIQNKN